MKILVTGHAGMIGHEVLSLLKRSGHCVTGFDCLSSYEEWEQRFDEFSKSIQPVDLIVHVGAVVDANVPSIDNETELWEMNYLATKRLGAYAKAQGSKFLFFSSYAAKEPQTPYGWGKRVAEDVLKLTLPKNDLCIFRPLVVWSFNEKNKRGPSIVYKILSQQLEFVYANWIRDCVHVSDVARAVNSVADKWMHGTYEIGTGKEIEIEALVREIYEHLPDSFEMPEVITSPLSYNYAVADPDNMLPGWQPKYEGDDLPALLAGAMQGMAHDNM